MFLKTFVVFFGVLGTSASVGVPVAVKELQKLRSTWGDGWTNASLFHSLSTVSGSISNEARKTICEFLGVKPVKNVSSSSDTSSLWNYECEEEGGKKHTLIETVESKWYHWSLKSSESKGDVTKIKCLRQEIKENGGSNTNVDWSQCRKK